MEIPGVCVRQHQISFGQIVRFLKSRLKIRISFNKLRTSAFWKFPECVKGNLKFFIWSVNQTWLWMTDLADRDAFRVGPGFPLRERESKVLDIRSTG